MLKPEIHDPQGEAIAGACHRLGFTEVISVRQGKRFEVEVAEAIATGGGAGADGAGGADAAGDGPATRVAELVAELLANPIIEEFAIHDA